MGGYFGAWSSLGVCFCWLREAFCPKLRGVWLGMGVWTGETGGRGLGGIGCGIGWGGPNVAASGRTRGAEQEMWPVIAVAAKYALKERNSDSSIS